MANREIDSILKDIEQYFKFLLDSGYKIQDVKDFGRKGEWHVFLVSPSRIIKIGSDQGSVSLFFVPVNSDSIRENSFSIESVIYFLSKGENFVDTYKGIWFRSRKNQLKKLSYLLTEYFEEITPLFGENFPIHKNDLISAGKKYFELFMDKYVRKRKKNDWE